MSEVPLSGRDAARAEGAQGAPTQSHIGIRRYSPDRQKSYWYSKINPGPPNRFLESRVDREGAARVLGRGSFL